MSPPPAASSSGIAARLHHIGPSRLAATIDVTCASSASASSDMPMSPALFTSRSTRPNRSPTVGERRPHRRRDRRRRTAPGAPARRAHLRAARSLSSERASERHGHPGIVQHPRDRRPDALRGAGHHCDLPGEVHRRTLPGGRSAPALTPAEISDILTPKHHTSDISGGTVRPTTRTARALVALAVLAVRHRPAAGRRRRRRREAHRLRDRGDGQGDPHRDGRRRRQLVRARPVPGRGRRRQSRREVHQQQGGGGGIGGRKLVLDFIDSHLNPNDARNGFITACENDFAMVGNATFLIGSFDDAVNCKDKAGQATGLPDMPSTSTNSEAGVFTGHLRARRAACSTAARSTTIRRPSPARPATRSTT